MTTSKVCILCKHFEWEGGYAGYYPGDHEDAAIICHKGHYNKSTCELPEVEYRETLLMADTCPDFEHRKATAETVIAVGFP